MLKFIIPAIIIFLIVLFWEKINEVIYKRLKIKIDNWGSILAFFCWLPIFGDPIAIGLGFFRTNLLMVSFWMFLGKLIRYIIWAVITYWAISVF